MRSLGQDAHPFFRQKLHATASSSPVRDLTTGGVRSPNGTVLNWRGRSKPTASSRAFLPPTIGRILRSHKLKPWRHHLWLSAKIPRVDEKTNLQPRSRLAATLPTRPGIPTRLEHGYKRVGALHLFAAFDTRTGKVYARTEIRKRQVEFLAFLSQLERELPSAATRVFLVMDNLKMHKGKLVQAWLATHPHFVCHFVPVHCSWMNQVEQWFSMLQRKRLRISDFAALAHVAERLMADVSAWNAHAHPFNWSTKSAAKVMAKCDPRIVHPLAA